MKIFDADGMTLKARIGAGMLAVVVAIGFVSTMSLAAPEKPSLAAANAKKEARAEKERLMLVKAASQRLGY